MTEIVNKNKNMRNVPNLRFPGFEGQYKTYSFEDIFLFSTGKNIKQNEAAIEFETPCVRYGELYHMYNEVISEVINKTNLDKSELTFSKGDEILLPSAGEDPLDIGSASALTIGNVAIGRTINILRPIKANVYSNIYVSYYINQKLRKKISTLAKGVSISNVYNSDLRTLEIIIPLLSEQNKISDFLSLINQRIQTQSKIIREQKLLKSALCEKIFVQDLNPKKNSNIFSDWKDMQLANVLIKNSIKNKGQKISLVQSVSNKFGFINQDEMFEDRRVASKDTSNYYVIENGYFAYNPSRIDVGSLAYKADHRVSIISPLYVSFKSNPKYLNDIYLLNWFSTEQFIKQMSNSFEGSVRNTLSYENLVKMKISIPSIEEQTTIANLFSTLDNRIDIEISLLQQLEKQKMYLLSNLFI